MITYGTNPGMGMPISAHVPDAGRHQPSLEKALSYMGLTRGRAAARPARSTWSSSAAAPTRASPTCARRPACCAGARSRRACACWWCPARSRSRRQAEAEGLDRVFREAGAEWREAGCSMCIAMNGDQLAPGQYAVSTSNRNFEGRQGAGGRTFLASPLTAAAAAVTGTHHRRAGERRWTDATWNRSRPSPPRPSSLPDRERRHRPDHPGALPQGHDQGRARRAPVRRLALRRRRRAQARLRPQPARGAGRAGAGRRRQLRLRLLARARALGAARLRLPRRDQHLASPTSSATTRSRTACCPSWSTRRSTPAAGAPGATGDGRPRGADAHPARRHARRRSRSIPSRATAC